MCTMHHPACHLQSVESGPNADQVHCSNQRTLHIVIVICAILWYVQYCDCDLCNIVIIICARFLLWFLHCCDLYKIVNVICGPIVDCALWGNQCWSSWGQGLLLLFGTPFLHTPLLHTRYMNVIHACIYKKYKYDIELALGDRYRKFYRTLNNAKKPFNSIFNSKNFQSYSFKILFI